MSLFSQMSIRRTLRNHPPCFTRTIYASSSRLQASEPQQTQQTTSTEKKEEPSPDSGWTDRRLVLKPLDRPLGVRQRPGTIVRSRTERIKDLVLDQETRMAQRRHLIKEAGKGYFHDMNMTRRFGGKTWIAPNVLIREDKALYFPNVKGQCLEDGTQKDTTPMCFGRISLIAMLGSQISQVHAASFASPTYSRFRDNPLFQYVQINLQENILKSFLVRLFSNNLRSTVPKELQSTYLVSSQNMEYVHEPLGMTNNKVGYVYLVDENLKIRWGGCADAQPKEAQALESCTGVLLKRLEEKNAEKAGKAEKEEKQGETGPAATS